MPETLETPEPSTTNLKSTGFSSKNITSKRDADALASAITAFAEAEEHVSIARSMLTAATYDLAHHLAVEATGGMGDAIMRRLPDDIRLHGMVAEARIDQKFLEEIIAKLAEARMALNRVADIF